MIQQIIIYILFACAIGYLVFKFFIPKKKKKSGDKNCDNCN